jgi:hypothetical protein
LKRTVFSHSYRSGTGKLNDRYKESIPSVYTSTSGTWIPGDVIIEAILVINTKPLQSTKTTINNAELMCNHFVKEHFNMGVSRAHVIFD